MTYYMGLDLSLTGTGIVVITDRPDSHGVLSDSMGEVAHQEIVGSSLEQDAPQREKTERMIYIAKRVVGVARQFTVGDAVLNVAIENFAFSTVKNAKGKSFQSSSQTGLAELHGIIKSQLMIACNLVPELYSVKTARMVVFGDGNLEKAKVRPLLNDKGYNFKKSDDADAFVIAECHRRKLRGWKDERQKKRGRGNKG